MLTRIRRLRPWVYAFTAAVMLAGTPAIPAMLGILQWRAFAICAFAAMLIAIAAALLWVADSNES